MRNLIYVKKPYLYNGWKCENQKGQKQHKITHFRNSYKVNSKWSKASLWQGWQGEIHTNFNPFDKKCDFFIFSVCNEMQQQHNLLSEYLGLNVCFYTLFSVCILGLNVYLYLLIHQKYHFILQIGLSSRNQHEPSVSDFSLRLMVEIHWQHQL